MPDVARRHRILVGLAVLFASTSLLYAGVWMAAVRYATPVELGYDADYLPGERAQLVVRCEAGHEVARTRDVGGRPGPGAHRRQAS